jgi:ATP-dependent DNA ligase
VAQEYKPGEIVPQSGIYTITHDPAHAGMPHEVTVIKDRRFPTCRYCRGISFELAHAAKHVAEIDHLKQAHAPAGYLHAAVMARTVERRQRGEAAPLPQWVAPQLTQLVDAAPDGDQWLHEIKYDGYRLHARLDRGAVKLLTRTGLDWTHKYPAIASAVVSLGAKQAYLDGELCGVGPDGITSFSMVQLASDSGNAAALVFFLFDLLHLDGEDVAVRPLIDRKARLAALLSDARSPLHYSDHQAGHGRAFHEKACAMSLEGIVSKRADAAYAPGNRGLWV